LLLLLVQYREIENVVIPEEPEQAGFGKARDTDASPFSGDRGDPDGSALERKTAHKKTTGYTEPK
jgi:hypothetical protein